MAIKLTDRQIKDGWQIVRFGDIAKKCNEKVDRGNNPFERYVEGGHMDSECLRIQRWGEFGDHYVGPAFHRIFRKGQILYGSRRTYLKKIAVAEFDGITANTTFVIEPQRPELLLPGLLPFIMLSDDFTNHSVLNSKGSTNPYINWGDIAKYEFPLPLIERQKKILEVLKKVQSIDRKVLIIKEKFLKLLNGFYIDYLAKILKIEEVPNRPLMITSNVHLKRLDELTDGKIQNGLFVRNGVIHKNKATFLNVQDIYGFPPKTINDLESVTCTDKELTSFKLQTGDLIYNRSSLVKDGIGWAYLCSDISKDTVYDCHLMRVSPINDVLSEYLLLYSVSPWARKYFMCISQTTTMTTIGQNELGSLPIPLPNMKLQREIVKAYKSVIKTLEMIQEKQRYLTKLGSKIMSELLSK